MKALTSDSFRQSGQVGFDFSSLNQGLRSVADFDALAAIGAQHARVFLSAERAQDGLYAVPIAQIAVLAKTVKALSARGVYTICALSLGESRVGAFWQDEAGVRSVVDIWVLLATKFKGNGAIAAFDLVNEPVPNGQDYAERQATWLRFAERAITAIRAVDRKRVVIVESAPNSIPQSFDTLRGLPFSNVVYSLHSYMPMEFTHQGVMSEHAKPLPYAPEQFKVLQESLQNAVAFAEKTGLPIYVGEFSAIKGAVGATQYIADSIALFRRYGWSYAYHEFRGWEGWDAEVSGADYIRSDEAPTISVLRADLARAR